MEDEKQVENYFWVMFSIVRYCTMLYKSKESDGIFCYTQKISGMRKSYNQEMMEYLKNGVMVKTRHQDLIWINLTSLVPKFGGKVELVTIRK
jgi:hypothetical protein